MTATGASAPQDSAVQPSAIGFGFPRLIPERPEPELPAPVPVTRHPKYLSHLKIPSSQGLRTGITFAGGDDVAVKLCGELETG